MTAVAKGARLAVDIGGTFTDVALEIGKRRQTLKVLTTPSAPEEGVMAGVVAVLEAAKLRAEDLSLIIHGTTLATNAIIERKGARTALITSEGFRDTIEMGTESRFEQYDLFMDKPPPLVPRYLRFTVAERVDARARVLVPLDEEGIVALVAKIEAEGVESVAVGFLHSYINPAHERRVRDILSARLPDLWITLSSEVSPEMREYERFSTACANAYVRPLMASYLVRLDARFRAAGAACPLLMMLSGGGLGTLDTARRFPVRLVESGPAAGAIFASHIARQSGLERVLSFDMGGTTAKICLVDEGQPRRGRHFEVARVYRFKKGSGLPLRIPVIEMIEIGAGGGSIACLDDLGRITVGPKSAGSEPGPACYGRGGADATVTDADLVMGRIDANAFSGGRMPLRRQAAVAAIDGAVGGPLGLTTATAAFGIGEMVDENMANAARVHAIESGERTDDRILVAFGGAAPLHAARLADKLGIDRVLVPVGAGVGSAIGLLRAPVAYEIVRSHYQLLSALDVKTMNEVLGEMRASARAVVKSAAPGAKVVETRIAFMRYAGQGHEISVPVPTRRLKAEDSALLKAAYDRAYSAQYGRVIPGVDIEVLSWALHVRAVSDQGADEKHSVENYTPKADAERQLFDADTGDVGTVPVYCRAKLNAGARIAGPAVIAEDDTSTVVTPPFDALVDDHGSIVLHRRRREEA